MVLILPVTRALIVGGGIIGMLTAWELHAAGLNVTLIEQGEFGRESSWAGGGIVSPLYPWRYPDSVTRLAQWSQAVYPELVRDLASTTGMDPEYEATGMLVTAGDELSQALKWAGQWNYRVELVGTERISQIEPGWKNPGDSVTWWPDVGHVRNPRLTKAAIRRLARAEIEMLSGLSVDQILLSGDKVSGIRSGDTTIAADLVILCTGAWTGKLLPDTPVSKVKPMRGQMILFRAEPGVVKRIVLEERRYLIPRRDGRVLCGSTLEDVGFDKATTEQARDELRAIACERFPALAGYEIETHWAGLRPASPGGIPYIDRHPEHANLFINAGHFRNGVVLGPASARLLADLVLERDPILPPDPYAWHAERTGNG